MMHRKSGGCRLSQLVLAILLLLPIGCSLGGSSAPKLTDPTEAARVAMETYDANGDGKLDEAELAKCPALKGALAFIDTNRDGAITPDEIAARVESYQMQSGFVGVTFHVTKGRRPLAGATVTLTPEPWLGKGFQVFAGETDKSGSAYVLGQEWEVIGVPTGLYQVNISHPSSNSEAIFGCEVSDDAGVDLTFAL